MRVFALLVDAVTLVAAIITIAELGLRLTG